MQFVNCAALATILYNKPYKIVRIKNVRPIALKETTESS